MRGFNFSAAGSAEAKDAWRNLFGNEHIGSIADLTDETQSYLAGLFIFCPFKLESALQRKGLMSANESLNDALARFTPEQQQVFARFLDPEIDWTRFDDNQNKGGAK
jgi:hypothetical protein